MVRTRVFGVLLSIVLLGGALASPAVAAGPGDPGQSNCQGDHQGQDCGLSDAQRKSLMAIARDTWKFYAKDVDPQTHLPMDNLTYAGGSPTPTSYGRYTSASNVGVYLWAVVAASDLGLISKRQATDEISATLAEVAKLKRDHGFLYQWYDTTNGHVIRNPGDIDCAALCFRNRRHGSPQNVIPGWCVSTRPGISRFPDAQLRI